MKISESNSYPHPVLAPWSDDIKDAIMESTITFQEEVDEYRVALHFSTFLNQPDIIRLIEEGFATFGCYIKCLDTGLRRLEALGFPSALYQFVPGAVLGRVQLRPMVWTVKAISYRPQGAHEEFQGTFNLGPGQILAMEDEQIVDVTRPPLATIESIFEIIASPELSAGKFELDIDNEKIVVRTDLETFKIIQQLRASNSKTRAVITNSLYVPMVMQVLSLLSINPEAYTQHRWYEPFITRCNLHNINLEKPNLLADSQKLLEMPFANLCLLTDQSED